MMSGARALWSFNDLESAEELVTDPAQCWRWWELTMVVGDEFIGR